MHGTKIQTKSGKRYVVRDSSAPSKGQWGGYRRLGVALLSPKAPADYVPPAIGKTNVNTLEWVFDSGSVFQGRGSERSEWYRTCEKIEEMLKELEQE